MITIWPVALAATVALAAYGAKRLDAAAQPLRLELAAKAEEFLAAADLKDSTRGYVNFLLDTAFGMRGAVLVSIAIAPLFALVILFKPSLMRRPICEPDDEALAARFHALNDLHDRITLANHPFLIPVFEAELSLVMLAWALRAAFDGVIPTISRNILLAMVERRTHRHNRTDGFAGVLPA